MLVCSPGFVKDQFYEYVFAEAVKQDIKLLMENKPKFLLVSDSNVTFVRRYALYLWATSIIVSNSVL